MDALSSFSNCGTNVDGVAPRPAILSTVRSGGYTGSSGRVTVTRSGETLGTYNASAASGTGTHAIWRSVNLTLAANGNVSLSPVQQFLTGTTGTVLRFLDGREELAWPPDGKP